MLDTVSVEVRNGMLQILGKSMKNNTGLSPYPWQLSVMSRTPTIPQLILLKVLFLMRVLILLFNIIVGEGDGTPLQYSSLENPMDGGAWKAAVHGVAKSWTRLSDFTFTFHFHALEKEMATHSSVLAWGIPGTGELGWLPSLGSHRVGHD